MEFEQSEPNDAAEGFAALGLRSELLEALESLGYEEPTPIQSEAIPPLLGGRDLLGQAATGTGKTAAFALPILERLAEREGSKFPMALVLVPTRELAMQVSQALQTYGRMLKARVLPVYGGQPIWRQLKGLSAGVDIVVATPGRAVDHLSRSSLDLDHLEMVVLDEADEMLDMGFAEDLETILAATPEVRQTMLFSATMPARIGGLARRYLHDPVRITIDRVSAGESATPQIRQSAYVVDRRHKPAALGRILDVEVPTATLVFCGTRNEVDQLTQVMNGRGYRAEALHGGLSQEQRDRVMDRLRSGTAELLVATDVAARGLDVDHLTHVVNYDVPSAPESYVHRIGRVGRAGREGVAITLIEPRQTRLLRSIEQHLRQRVPLEPLPTVADLRARRLELTRQALLDKLAGDEDLDRFQGVIDSLTDDFDVVELTLAAIAVAYESSIGLDETDEQDLPHLTLKENASSGGGRADRSPGGPSRRDPASGRARRRGPSGVEMVRVYIGAGRNQGIRPGDLVGAIANETSLSGAEIGNIEITPNFSLVEVPEPSLEQVIRVLRRSTIRGRKAAVRKDRDTSV